MQLPNPETLLVNITAQIAAQLNPNTALVGIHSGGVWLMQRSDSSTTSARLVFL